MKQAKRRTPDDGTVINLRTARTSDLGPLSRLYEQLNLAGHREVEVSKGEMRRAYQRVRHHRNRAIPIATSWKGSRDGACDPCAASGDGLLPIAMAENVVVDGAASSPGVGAHLMEAATKIVKLNRCQPPTSAAFESIAFTGG